MIAAQLGEPCVVCSAKTYPQTASPEAKADYRARGWKRRAGRGACVNCFVRYRKAGRLNELSLVHGIASEGDGLAKICSRCGIAHRMPEDLCQDCHLVVADLGELRTWSA